MNYKKLLIYSTVIIVIGVIVLSLMGRTLWGSFDDPCFLSLNINSQSNSQCVVDAYSITHFLHGFSFYLLLWIFAKRVSWKSRLLIAVGLATSWEILENTEFIINRYRESTLSLEYVGDSILNSVSDIVVMMVGFWTANRLKPTHSVLLFIGLEILLLLWIRDNLILNIILLAHPVEILKNWQLSI